MGETKKPFADPLVRDQMFPDPAALFGFVPESLEVALESGLIVVDTNVLLVPYTTTPASLEQVRRTFQELTSKNRLRIPGQVAREFAPNKFEKIKDIFKQLADKQSWSGPKSNYQMLDDIPEYKSLLKHEENIGKALEAYRESVSKLLDVVSGWNCNDPVSAIYRDLFSAEIVVEPPLEKEKLLHDLKYRQEHSIPPGYKDKQNEYSGIGDYLIWQTILHIGNTEKNHLVFVSGDEKSDWLYRSANRGLHPRFELLDEYRRASGGKSFHIINFSGLLEHFGVPAPVVEEVRQEEGAVALVVAPDENKEKRFSFYWLSRAKFIERWVRSRHLDGDIEYIKRKYDIYVVRSQAGACFYVAVFIWHSREVQDELRRVLKEINNIVNPELITVHIVLVIRESAPSASVDRVANFLRLRGRSAQVDSIIVGVLGGSGVFEEKIRLEIRRSGNSDRSA